MTVSACAVLGSSLFQLENDTQLISLSGVPSAPETTAARLFVETASVPLRRNSGIALVNPGTETAIVTMTLTTADGKGLTSRFTLGPGSHTAMFVTELFPELTGDYTGLLDLSSSAPLAAIALRMTVNPRGEIVYAPLPMIDLDHPAPLRLIIPQVVDGGGYSTRFTVLETAPAGLVFINVFDKNGVKKDGTFR